MGTLRVPVTQHDHIRGPANAPVIVVEYGDYECPHCGLAHPIVNAVREHFARQLRFVFRHFPLIQVHPECRNGRRERGIRRRPSLRAKANSSGKPNR
jgi:protein-disulfide isomerase